MDCLIFWGSFVLTVVLRTKNRGLDQLFGAFLFCALLGAKKCGLDRDCCYSY